MRVRMVEKERQHLLKRMHKKNKGAILESVTDDKALSREPGRRMGMQRRWRRGREGSRNSISCAGFEKKLLRNDFVDYFENDISVLWPAGAAIFQAAEYGQNWPYFGSLYFSYTSLLTIGYGDFYPQSDSEKPFFVF